MAADAVRARGRRRLRRPARNVRPYSGRWRNARAAPAEPPGRRERQGCWQHCRRSVAPAAFRRRSAAPHDRAWPKTGLLFWPDGRPWQGAAQGRGRDQVGGSTAESTRPKRQLRVAGRTRDAPPPLDAHQRLVLRLLRFEDYCAAKQYKNPAPPVAIRFCWLQPWLGCTEFQDAFGPPSRSK